jgi:hypothetical protein
MNKETIKNTVSLFLHCQKLISNPRRIHFTDLQSLLSPVIDEKEFHSILKSIFSLSDHYFLLQKYKHPEAILADINSLAILTSLQLDPNQKLIFITILLKLIKMNKEENNKHLGDAVDGISEIFSFTKEQRDSIKKLFFQEGPTESDYKDSILLTNEKPDYTKVIDGMKVIYNPDFKFQIWIKNINSINDMLFKVIGFDKTENEVAIKAGDVSTCSEPIQLLMGHDEITINTLSYIIISNAPVVPLVEIPATEKSPRILLNAFQNSITIEGISSGSNPFAFFEPVFYWLKKMEETKPEFLAIHINLTFFNTYSSKILLNIFSKALEFESFNCDVRIYWHYEGDDEDMKEAGEYYESIINKSFIFLPSVPMDLTSIRLAV